MGNGDWCITMGGRDCSLQMHEQKLLEVSVTEEELKDAIEAAKAAGKTGEATQLTNDLNILQRMETRRCPVWSGGETGFSGHLRVHSRW